MTTDTKNEALAAIARQLNVHSLTSIKAALEAAYAAGKESRTKPEPHPLTTGWIKRDCRPWQKPLSPWTHPILKGCYNGGQAAAIINATTIAQ
jgi:hypothetical protein